MSNKLIKTILATKQHTHTTTPMLLLSSYNNRQLSFAQLSNQKNETADLCWVSQTFKGQGQFQTNVESQVSAMAYFDLIVRSITEPGLIQIVIRFLLDEEKFDGQRILDVLVERLNSNDSRVSAARRIFA